MYGSSTGRCRAWLGVGPQFDPKLLKYQRFTDPKKLRPALRGGKTCRSTPPNRRIRVAQVWQNVWKVTPSDR